MTIVFSAEAGAFKSLILVDVTSGFMLEARIAKIGDVNPIVRSD